MVIANQEKSSFSVALMAKRLDAINYANHIHVYIVC